MIEELKQQLEVQRISESARKGVCWFEEENYRHGVGLIMPIGIGKDAFGQDVLRGKRY